MFYQPNIYIFLILILIGIFLVFLFYRKDTIVARSLRITSVIILVLLLVEPIFFAFISRETLAVLIDTSKSMEPKKDTLKWWMQRIDSLPLRKQNFWFDTTLYNRKDGGGATDITKAIELLPSNIGSVLLLSDGIYTRGRDPSTVEFSIPVYPIPLEQKGGEDFRIVGYRRNYYVYKGDTTILEAVIEGEGCENIPAWFILYEAEDEITKVPVLLPPDGTRKSYRLEIVPDSPGVHIYTLRLDVEGKESSLSFPMNVLDRRIRVLYISKSPSFNLKFIKIELLKDSKIEFNSIIELVESRWLINGEMKNGDIDIENRVKMLDPDVVFLEGIEVSYVKKYIDDGGRCFVVGKGQISPFILGKKPEREGKLQFVKEAFVQSDESFPFLIFFDVIGVKRGVKILADVKEIKTAQGNMAVFATIAYGEGEIYSIASEDLTPISFSPIRESRFWIDLIRWIIQRGDVIHMETDKPVYKPGDNIRITAETRHIIQDDISIEVRSLNDQRSGKEYKEEKYLYKKTPTTYELVIDYLPPGRYEYTSRVGENYLKGEFYVEESIAENPTPYADFRLLTELALRSRGRIIYSPEDIRISMGGSKEKYPLFPSKSPLLIVLLIVLLSVEWWILRR